MKESIHVTIERREGPSENPYTSEYEVPLERGMSILNALDYVAQHCDSTLSYEASCRRGLCSVCMVNVNGKVIKSCMELAEVDLVIKSGSKNPLKDLAFTSKKIK